MSTSYLTPYRSKALYTRSVHLCYNKNIIILPTQTSFFYSASSSHDYRHEKRNKRFDSARKASYMALWVGLFDADVWFSSHSALLPFARPRDNGENMLTTKLCYYLECWLIILCESEKICGKSLMYFIQSRNIFPLVFALLGYSVGCVFYPILHSFCSFIMTFQNYCIQNGDSRIPWNCHISKFT